MRSLRGILSSMIQWSVVRHTIDVSLLRIDLKLFGELFM